MVTPDINNSSKATLLLQPKVTQHPFLAGTGQDYWDCPDLLSKVWFGCYFILDFCLTGFFPVSIPSQGSGKRPKAITLKSFHPVHSPVCSCIFWESLALLGNLGTSHLWLRKKPLSEAEGLSQGTNTHYSPHTTTSQFSLYTKLVTIKEPKLFP